MAKDPAFLFYPNDWIGGTMGMTFEEKGAYMELLMMQFNRGHMSEHMITHMINVLWPNIKDKFIQDENGLWYNKRLEEEQEKRKSFTESRRNNRASSTGILESDSNKTDIYIIKDNDSGNIKIGASINPKNRLSTIKSRQGLNVVLIATVKDCTLRDEKEIHYHYKDFNIKGDWFNLKEGDVIGYIKTHMTNHMIIHMENEDVNEIKDINIPFENFWDLYEKKVGDKIKIEKKWNKLTNEERNRIMEYIPKYKKATPDKKYRKNPDTFFNQKAWNDEIIGLSEDKTKILNSYEL